MADITKCTGDITYMKLDDKGLAIVPEFVCPLRDKCYRYTATEGMRQSYFEHVPYNRLEDDCEYLWERDK